MTGPTFTARYPGTCSGCGSRINPGDQCTWLEDEIVHRDCEAVAEVEAAEVCGECWMTKPCYCEEPT